MSVCVGWGGRGCKLCHPLILVRNREGWAPSQQRNYLGALTSSLKGYNISMIVDLEDCITSPFPEIPSVAILFNQKCCVESRLSVPQMSAKTCPKAQVCLRAHINNQTIPSSHRNGPHLCCHHQVDRLSTPPRFGLWCFRAMQPNQVGLAPSTSCDHLKGARKPKGGNVRWHLIVKPECIKMGEEDTCTQAIKACFLGRDIWNLLATAR